MYLGHHTAEVTNLSPEATEKDVYEFFYHCGEIEQVEIIRLSEHASVAYVTFKDTYALEIAVLLSGSTILDQCVRISCLEVPLDEANPWNSYIHKMENGSSSAQLNHTNQFVSTPGEAVTVAQQVVVTMIVKGYQLSKDALTKAKAFDESHQLSSTAAAKVADLSKRVGLTDKIQSGMETVKCVDEKYHLSEVTKSAASYTGKTAVAAATAVVNSSYFSKGALWVSDVLNRAAKVVADLGNNGVKKETVPMEMDQIGK
ncbi:binding partner of ACD11 1 isoform X1 [Lycium ferocissimum]|uniref:binding partner of ACD11 1 isoform X1 n=1 Tax=Lycium ferocissimum TaxID=112874 RepID=UPI0028161240|nr:binding partner of ACD11 1 isoform X1 [Lycium ferocissimum]XP_059284172.1 binding partner of ACD11 1 isoform X1 [Lycium ferocissimum]XP_059284180.1 binding partner of ACD11 1 isoform X1 [Lycium ferocissimum]XP_059284186.1 binding partner of ACD11 1 isoform X1 [Lycium ferocissimum]